MYADDVLLFRIINSPEDFDRLQNDIDEVGNWSSINFLTLNRDKCKYMIVSRRKTVSTPSSPLLLEGHSLERVEMFKYLGVLLSHDLSWGEHVQAICSKAIGRSLAFCTGDSKLMLLCVQAITSKGRLKLENKRKKQLSGYKQCYIYKNKA